MDPVWISTQGDYITTALDNPHIATKSDCCFLFFVGQGLDCFKLSNKWLVKQGWLPLRIRLKHFGDGQGAIHGCTRIDPSHPFITLDARFCFKSPCAHH